MSKTLSTVKRSLTRRIALIVAGVSSVAIIGSAGLAAAHPAQHTMYMPNRQVCASRWHDFGFKNRGGCESYWNRHRPHQHPGQGGGGNGYGGNSTGITIVVNGNGNVISIVINYFFG